MLSVTCYLGRFRNSIEMDFPLTLSGRTITEFFRLGSMNPSGQAGIDLRVVESRFNASVIPGSQPTNAYSLHTALARLTRNSANSTSVDRIGLIIADQFQNQRELLGLMFDQGFNPRGIDAVGPLYTNVAREGCAIFLEPIRNLRPILGDYRREVVFTAIHELGHVFNLWHIERPVNFMSSSNIEQPWPTHSYYFHPVHRSFLHNAATDPHCMPGGTHYGSRGPYGPAPDNPFNAARFRDDLQISISVSQDECWYFEPIELDIRLRARKNKYQLPNEIDPGYDSFVIYITRPDGTCFRYRSPISYGGNLGTVNVGPGKEFLRDISLFGQAGGYTFQSPGEYRVQCVFDTGLGFRIMSNPLPVYIKAPMTRNRKFLQAAEKLTSQKPALMLYHRSGNFKKNVVDELLDVAGKNKNSHLESNILYAVARFKTSKRIKLSAKELQFVSQIGNKALDSGRLGPARQKNLMQMQRSLVY